MSSELQFVTRDAIVAVPWAAANLLLLRAAWGLRESVYPGPAGAARVLDVGVVYCAGVVLALTILGTLNLFTGHAMVAGVNILAAAGLLLARRLRVGGPPAPLTRDSQTWDDRSAWIGWTIAFGLLCGHVIVDGLLRFPTDYDCLMYHMPLVDQWLRAGSLYAPDSGAWWLAANSELLAAWMTGPFSGDFLIALNNIPIVIVWAAAAIELGRRLGMSGVWPHLGAVATLCVHTLLHETDDASNDLMVGAFGLAAAAYTLRVFASDRRTDLILFGVAVGLLAGVKYFALGYAAVCGGALALGLILCRGWRPAIQQTAIAAAAALPFCSYWYARNLAITGLPLYPMGVKDATAELGYPDVWSTSFAGNGDPQLFELGMEAIWRMAGPIHYVAAAAAPALAALLAGSALRLRLAGTSDPVAALKPLLLAVWLAGSGLVFLITPFSVEDQPGTLNHLRWAYTPVRYGLCFLNFAVLSAALLLNQAARLHGIWLGRMTATFMAAICAWQVILRVWMPTEFDFATAAIVAVDVALFTAIAAVLLRQGSASSRAASWALPAIAVLAVAAGAAHLSERWHQGFAGHFDRLFDSTAFARLERDFPSGARVVVFDHRPYPFFGAARQHAVVDPRFFVSRPWLDEFVRRQVPDVMAVGHVGGGEFNRYRGTLRGVSAVPGFTSAGVGGHYHVFLASAERDVERFGDAAGGSRPAVGSRRSISEASSNPPSLSGAGGRSMGSSEGPIRPPMASAVPGPKSDAAVPKGIL